MKPRARLHGPLIFLALAVLPVLNSCAPPSRTPQPADTPALVEATRITLQPTPTKSTESELLNPTPTGVPVGAPTQSPDLRLRYEMWQGWPILPGISPEMVAVFEEGQRAGRDSRAFSVIGDCQSSPTYFLNLYDEGRYSLAEEDQLLQETIDWYAGSYSHRSITVANGLTAPGALNPRWSDPEQCRKNENPIDCEIRLHNPSVVLISLGTNWHPSLSQEEYLDYLFQIIDTLLEHHIVPVLSTKADNVEGDHNRNQAMAQAAYERHIPLWNFWAAVQHLPNHGLDKTRNNEYLTRKGWDIRNLSALQLLDRVRRQLTHHEE